MSKVKVYQRYLGLLLGLLVLTFTACGGGGKEQPVDISTRAEFVGANNCGKCHTEKYNDWLETPHAVAFVDLPSADQDNPVCLGCHNTNYTLEDVQCEACHGPGGLHRGIGPIKLSYQDTVCKGCHENDMAISATHDEVYQQWAESGHAEEEAAAWYEFSDEATGRHASTYPIKMSNDSAGNFVCFQCHNGIGALSYIENTILTPAAITVNQNATAECATCHNPHEHSATKTNALGDITTDHHIRLPEALSFNSSVASVYRAFTFLDGTDIPQRIGNGIICVYCHQGRSSGLVLNTNVFDLAAGASGRRFENDHYLAAGAVLWGRNGYEYSGHMYTRDIGHNSAASEGCIGCHMENSNTGTEGGHTWKMVNEETGAQNVAACNISGCHDGLSGVGGPVTAFEDFTFNGVDYDGDTDIEGVAEEIGGFFLDAYGAPTDGLLGALVAAFEDPAGPNLLYNPNSYPYFFKADGSSTTPSDWTNVNLAAAFNLNMLVKTVKQYSPLPVAGFEGGVNIHNPYYTIQLLVDSLDSLGAATGTQLANRPTGSSPATPYPNPL